MKREAVGHAAPVPAAAVAESPLLFPGPGGAGKRERGRGETADNHGSELNGMHQAGTSPQGSSGGAFGFQ